MRFIIEYNIAIRHERLGNRLQPQISSCYSVGKDISALLPLE